MKIPFLLFYITVSTTLNAQTDSINTHPDVILVTEPIPYFPGGAHTLKKFIEQNLSDPKRNRVCTGTVYISFKVNVDGHLSDVEIVKGIGDPCNASAIMLIKKMPNWIPATSADQPVAVKMVLPIKFDD